MSWWAGKGKGSWGSDDWSWGASKEESSWGNDWNNSWKDKWSGKGSGKAAKVTFSEDQKVFVGNLPKTATKESLQEFFGKFDTVLDVHNVVDEDRVSRGFAFIAFEHLATVDYLTKLPAPLVFEEREIIIKPIFKPGEPKGGKDEGKGKFGKKGGCRFQSAARIFVGGLPDSATPDKVKKHFEQYGAVTDIHIKLTEDGTSRGFGFITFENVAVAEYVKMNAANTQFEGHWIVCKAGGDKQQNYAGQRVFLGGLPKTTTPGAVHAYFSQFGVITNVDLKYDQQGVFRNFGFIIFQDKDIADKVCLEQHALDGKQIDVKPAMDHDGTFKVDRDNKGAGKGTDLTSAYALAAGGGAYAAGGDALAQLGLAGVDSSYLLALAGYGGGMAATGTAGAAASLGGVGQPGVGYGVGAAGTIDPNLLALASLSGMGGGAMSNAATLAATLRAMQSAANPAAAAAGTGVAGAPAAAATTGDPAAQMADLATQAAQFADHASQVAAQAAAQAAQLARDPSAEAAQAAPTAQALQLTDAAGQAAQLTAPGAQASQLAAPTAQASQLQASQLFAQMGQAAQLTGAAAQPNVPAAPTIDPAVLAALGLGGDQAGAAGFAANFGVADANSASVRAAPY